MFLIFGAALLYSSVGHAGASGYLAVMALVGMAPATMRPTALVLNVLVAVIATLKFARAGCFSWRLFWPFAATSVPMALLGGYLALPGRVYKIVVGLVLVYSAVHLLWATRGAEEAEARSPKLAVALVCGAGIGLLSGLTGVGGGIFLSPLILLLGWAATRETAGVSAAFILVNSLAGLAGQLPALASLPASTPGLAVAAIGGGWLGSTYGSRRVGERGLKRILAVVLLIAGAKIIAT